VLQIQKLQVGQKTQLGRQKTRQVCAMQAQTCQVCELPDFFGNKTVNVAAYTHSGQLHELSHFGWDCQEAKRVFWRQNFHTKVCQVAQFAEAI
jgi:hypothetical protein